jgi:CO/xanthine dehydrogenase Mo-binding subunit
VTKVAGKYRFIGRVTPRMDAAEIVTGRARFLNDIKLPDMLYGKVLRSPHPHALIKKVDKSKAEKLRGVRAILTWEDVPDWKGGTPRTKRVLDRKVRFVGDAVALAGARPLSMNAYKIVIAKTLVKRAILESVSPRAEPAAFST